MPDDIAITSAPPDPTQDVAPPDAPPIDPTPPGETPPPPAAAAPVGITPDQLAAHTEQLMGGLATTLRDTIAGMRQPAPTGPTGPQDVTDDEINQAAAEGRPIAPLIQRRAEAIAHKQSQAVRAEVEALRQQGSTAIAQLVADRVKAHPQYKKYGREMDAALAQLPEAARLNPAAVTFTINAVVGAHADEIEQEAMQRAARQAREQPTMPVAGVPGRAATPVAVQVDPKQVLGQGAYDFIQSAGDPNLSADQKLEQAARRLGYPSAQAWLKTRLAAQTPEGNA